VIGSESHPQRALSGEALMTEVRTVEISWLSVMLKADPDFYEFSDARVLRGNPKTRGAERPES